MKHTHRWLAVHIALQWCVGLCQHTVVTLYLSSRRTGMGNHQAAGKPFQYAAVAAGHLGQLSLLFFVGQ